MKLVYLSRDRKDKAYAERFATHMKPLLRSLGLSLWHRTDTTPGAKWQEEMAEHLKQAICFVPLLSADFLASDTCYAESQAAMHLCEQGKLSIVPVLIRTCSVEYSFFGKMEVLPQRDKPITEYPNADTGWLEVHNGFAKILGANSRGYLE